MNKEICMNEYCDKPAHSRGLCINCYRFINDRINDKRVDEQDLIDAGKILPKQSKSKSRWFYEGVTIKSRYDD